MEQKEKRFFNALQVTKTCMQSLMKEIYLKETNTFNLPCKMTHHHFLTFEEKNQTKRKLFKIIHP